jgi:hypothetical protein
MYYICCAKDIERRIFGASNGQVAPQCFRSLSPSVGAEMLARKHEITRSRISLKVGPAGCQPARPASTSYAEREKQTLGQNWFLTSWLEKFWLNLGLNRYTPFAVV